MAAISFGAVALSANSYAGYPASDGFTKSELAHKKAESRVAHNKVEKRLTKREKAATARAGNWFPAVRQGEEMPPLLPGAGGGETRTQN
jgi:hypothetical protein